MLLELFLILFHHVQLIIYYFFYVHITKNGAIYLLLYKIKNMQTTLKL